MSIDNILQELQQTQKDTTTAIQCLEALKGSQSHLLITHTGQTVGMKASEGLSAENALILLTGTIGMIMQNMDVDTYRSAISLLEKQLDPLMANLEAMEAEIKAKEAAEKPKQTRQRKRATPSSPVDPHEAQKSSEEVAAESEGE